MKLRKMQVLHEVIFVGCSFRGREYLWLVTDKHLHMFEVAICAPRSCNLLCMDKICVL